MRALAPLLALTLIGCSSTGPASKPTNGPRTAVQAAPVELPRGPEADEIARLEAAVDDGHGRLTEFLAHEDPRVRRRAAQSLGRLPIDGSIDDSLTRRASQALCRALEDPEIRLEAAFALGMRGDPTSAGVVAAYMNDVDGQFRARLVEAASRIPDEELHHAVVLALRDADLGVRIEAALGTARWDPKKDRPEGVDRALLDALRPYTIAPGRTARTAPEAELVWRILFALARRGNEIGRGAFLEYATSDVPLERLFALQGLARVEADPEVVAAAEEALRRELERSKNGSADWRVAYEATRTLKAFASESSVEVLIDAVGDENLHTRAGAIDALAVFRGTSDPILGALRRGLADLSTSVRAAAILSLSALLPSDKAVDLLEKTLRDEDPIMRLAVADAATQLRSPGSAGLLRRLVADPVPLVATRAAEGLGKHLGPEVRGWLHELLRHHDNGIRLAAVSALREEPSASDAPFLIEAFGSSEGDIAAEVAFNVLESLGLTPDAPGALELVNSALADPRPYVREVAARELVTHFGRPAAGPRTAGNIPNHPWIASQLPKWTHNPLVEISTTRGNMLFELFPAEAPVHVWNFIQLARKGAYDGTIFHRVVPDFVVQGGDYRGDGNGGRPWRGDSLRQEFGPRKYVRGSLGMPRNAYLDSGGSQIFVTHRPTPHLDGRYTIFGELRVGGAVLDHIEVGDRILGISLLPTR